ncbi:hypothetical protein DH2020_026946 [Rehmannia glutinosa]|uniref:Sucrose transport protein n=1 Tax=Rehmannia glutinosa TaxID=99300 RepID=A0ABR0VVH4_REHGL
MDGVSIRVPYRNLKQEVELVSADESEHRRSVQIHDPSSVPGFSGGGDSSPDSDQHNAPPNNCSLLTLILSCTVAAGVQFGWALQLSLLTPYIQTLGIGHEFSSFIWLCGPITGLVVQPCVGIWSDKCTSKYGRRRPFILVGSLMISVAGPARALLADLSGPDQRNSANAIFCTWMAVGNILGFSSGASGNWHRWFPFLTSRACCEPCGNLKAAFLVAVVFLVLCTLVTLYFAKEVPLMPKQSHHLADSAPLLDDHQLNGSHLSKSKTDTELKDYALEIKSERQYTMNNGDRSEEQKDQENNDDSFMDSPGAVLVNLLTSLRHLPPAMHSVLVVMALTWLSWFPFFLFDTDWMGREVFMVTQKERLLKFKLIIKVSEKVVLGISSFFIEPMCQWIGARLVWAISNFVVFVCMAGTAIISLISVRQYSDGVQHVIGANGTTKIASLVVFALLGLPLAITYSVPFSVTAELTADSGGGQGLAIGVLNLAIVIPQGSPDNQQLYSHLNNLMFCAAIYSSTTSTLSSSNMGSLMKLFVFPDDRVLGAGPWDALFGGGNIPAFVLASISALAAGVIAVHKLPTLSSGSYKSTGFHFG